jgi:3-isopropylmalate dehydrogenase
VAERIVVLPGDGIGPEVAAEALRVLERLPVDVEVVELPFGGAAIDELGEPLPASTLAACREADAVLLGAVGGPRWDGDRVRPEHGLIRLRRELDVYANLRPAALRDIDLVVVRELVGGLYYGPRGTRDDGTVFDTCEYHPDQIERVARRAFELARSRWGVVTSVDKANVLDTSRLWRRVVGELAEDYADVELRHAFVDAAAMQLVTDPRSFDVIVTENTFGDILSDVAAAVTGGLGLAPSASLADDGPGIFEPVHGSAPDLAGTGAANPAAMLRSLALLLEHALGRPDLARDVEGAVDQALAAAPTPDLGGTATTAAFGDAVLDALEHDSTEGGDDGPATGSRNTRVRPRLVADARD